MSLNRLVILAGAFCFCLSKAFAQQPIDTATELDAMRSALLAGDASSALKHAFAVQQFATAQSWPPKSPLFRAHFAKPGDTSVMVADQIGLALKGNDIFEFKVYATALPVVVMKDLTPPSSTPSEVAPQPIPGSTPSEVEIPRIFALPRLAKRALDAGDMALASRYAVELLSAASQYPNLFKAKATFSSNTVAGLIAVRSGNVDAARSFLLAAGTTSGDPVLNSFGPNMLLASELLARGDRASVIEYLAECAKFWEKDVTEQWAQEIQQGRIPEHWKYWMQAGF
jgi:hypothetical protein